MRFFKKLSVINIGYYFLASFVPMLISLGMAPLLALFLEPRDYAVISYYNSFNALFFPLILFYLNQYYMREFFYCDEKGRRDLFAMIFKTFLWFPFLMALLVVVAFGAYMKVFNPLSEIPYLPYALLSFFSIAFSSLFYLEQVLLKNNRNGRVFFILSVVNSMIVAVSSLVLVAVLDMGALGRMIGIAFAPVLLFLWLIYKHKDLIAIKVDRKILRKAMVFCWPLVIAAMMGFFTNGIDRVLLEKYVSIEELGYYSIGISIAGYLSVFSSAIGNTFSPDVLESLAQNRIMRMLKFVLLQLAIISLIAIIFSLFARYFIIVFTANRYLEATPYARIAAFASITSICYTTVSNVVFSYKKTQILLYAKIIGSIVCFILYWYLIKNFSLSGAAFAYTLGNLVLAFTALLVLFLSLQRDKRRINK